MRLYAWTVHDVKAEYFMPPFTTRSIGEALRGFGDHARDPQSMANKHPHDFRLFLCGWFDQVTGQLEMCEPVDYGSAYEIGRVDQVELPTSDIEPQSEELELS